MKETPRFRFTRRSRRACVAACAAAAAVVASAAAPALVWSDEFNQPAGAAPDPLKWDYDLGRGNPAGWGNQELETYTNSRNNSFVAADPAATDGRVLVIRAIKEPDGGYTSARLVTRGRQSFTGGRLEARMKMPVGRGLWPAFWALGDSIATVGWPACGEIDVMEWVGPAVNNATVVGSLHSAGASGTRSVSGQYSLTDGSTFSDAYHVFAVDWYLDQFVFSVDGRVYQQRKKSELPSGLVWPFEQPFHLLVNFAVGGTWPGPPDASTVFPAEFRVDYVRVYSLPSAPPAGLVFAPAPPTGLTAGSSRPGQIDLAWAAPSDTFGAPLSGYRLERATDPGFTQNLLVRDVGPVTTFTDRGHVAGHDYYYRVAAMTANGVSTPATAASARMAVASERVTPGMRLVALSTRAYVGTGTNVAIMGFVLQGSELRRVLVRGVGPGLVPLGVGDAITDPVLTLFDQTTGAIIARNDDWGTDTFAAEASAAAAATGDFALAAGSRDAALVVDLPGGIYTAVVEGKNGATGPALLEVYEVPMP